MKTRRSFLKTAAVSAAGVASLPTILTSCSNWKGANSRVNVAHIGVGGRGTSTMEHYFLPLENARSVAVSDPYLNRMERASGLIRSYYSNERNEDVQVDQYQHFEELLERADIDAVHISTGDYWHLPIAIQAARAGKHIYLEKPLGLSLDQMMVLEKTMQKSRLVFHYGTQQRSLEHCQKGIRMIQNGEIGKINHIDIWAPQGEGAPVHPDDNVMPVGFDFDRWLGPAPEKEYSFARCGHATGIYHTYDYALGYIAGWGAHPLDIAVWGAKDLFLDVSTHQGIGRFFPEGMLFDTIASWDVQIQFRKGLTAHFMSTDLADPTVSKYLPGFASDGTAFFGEKGWISLSRGQAASDLPEIHARLNEKVLGENGQHGLNFIKAIQGEIDPIAPLDDAILSDCISHLGNIAIRTGEAVQWDAVFRRFPEKPELEKSYFNRIPRAPYEV